MDILYYFSVVLCTRRFIPCAVPLVQLGNTRQTLSPGIKCRSTPSKVAEQDSNFYRGTAASRFFRAYVDVMHAMVQCTQCGQARTFTGLGKSSPCCLAPEFHAARGIERFFIFHPDPSKTQNFRGFRFAGFPPSRLQVSSSGIHPTRTQHRGGRLQADQRRFWQERS